MRLRSNILVNYAGQAYITLIGLVVVPVYVAGLGEEAYGLIGFFAMLQAWFMLLDLGMTATLTREAARASGGATHPRIYRRLYDLLSSVSAGIALVAAGAIWLSSDAIARRWLGEHTLEPGDVEFAVQVMAVAIGCRWLAGLYRGVLVGAERLALLNVLNAAFATLRFLAVIVTMEIAGYSVRVFFAHQLAVALLEALWLRAVATRMVSALPAGHGEEPVSVSQLRSHFAFALSVTFTSSVWVVVTQSDKLILSRLLSLSDYGLFSMATLLAGGVVMVAVPITGALLPRLAAMEAEGRSVELVDLYRKSTRLVSVVAGAAMLTLVFFAELVIHAWTGRTSDTRELYMTVTLYAFGNGCLNFSSLVYCIQYARGRVRMHVIGNALLLACLLPLVFWLVPRWGLVGAGVAWATVHLAYLLFWVTYTHAHLVRGLAMRWLLFDVLVVLAPGLLGGWLLSAFGTFDGSRAAMIVHVLLAGGAMVLLCYCGQLVSRRLEARVFGESEAWVAG